ncbi:MAG: BsuPI-related putative proteinase inhibitor [Halobacteriales archaeon]
MDLSGELSTEASDDAVQFTYRVRNRGDEPVDLRFRSGQRIDVVVTEADSDRPAWRASDGRMYTMAIGFVHLDPGEAATFEEVWREPRPGAYRAEATLAADGVAAPAETTFDVG